MEIFGISVLMVFLAAGLISLFFGIFGTFIILGSTVIYALLTGFRPIGFNTLFMLLMLYLMGEILEYAFVIIGAKKFGASNKAVVGAIIGGILGSAAGAVSGGIGLVPATFLGIFLGAFVVEYLFQRDLVKSLKAGAGGVFGRIGALAAKIIIAIIMIAIIASRLFL